MILNSASASAWPDCCNTRPQTRRGKRIAHEEALGQLSLQASASRQGLQSVLSAHRHLLPSALAENATFLVSWRAARSLGGAIRYRLQDQPIPAGDTGAAGNSSTPPPASGSGTEDEESGDPCLSQAEDLDGDIEASGSSGGVFLDSAASGSDPSEDQSNPSHYVPTWRRGSESPPPRSTKTASP